MLWLPGSLLCTHIASRSPLQLKLQDLLEAGLQALAVCATCWRGRSTLQGAASLRPASPGQALCPSLDAFLSWVKFSSSILQLKDLRITPETRGARKHVERTRFLKPCVLTKPECRWLKWPPPDQACSQIGPDQGPQWARPMGNVPLLKGSGKQASDSFRKK